MTTEEPQLVEEGTTRLLEVRDLTTAVDGPDGPVTIVDGVSLDLETGQTLGVVGESGSGKSMLARSLMGLLDDRRSNVTGSVRLAGAELVGLPRRALRRHWGAHIGMVFQDPMTALSGTVRIGDQLTESLRHHLRLGHREARAEAVSLLRSVGIPEPERRLREYPHQLSGGMRQRVTIAAAISCGPRLLLADEPTTALDVTVQRQILDLLMELQSTRHMGLLLISHDLGVIAGRTDHIAVMYAGRIVERCRTRELFAQPQHPYTAALLRSIPRMDKPIHQRLQVISGQPPSPTSRPPGCAFARRCTRATARCLQESPVLIDLAPGHEVACFHPVGTEQESTDRGGVAGEDSIGLTSTGSGES